MADDDPWKHAMMVADLPKAGQMEHAREYKVRLSERNGRAFVFCPRCKVNVVWPAVLVSDDKSRVATEMRARPAMAAKLVHLQFGLDLRETKALIYHITVKPGECHRCHRPVQGEVSICANCQSACLNW
jgi:hypothetical protein